MNDAQRELMEQARDSLNAAKLLLQNAYPDIAASRAYYAMFYLAEAFLEGDGLAFSKHSAVIGGFGLHFGKSGRVPKELHSYLIDAEDARHIADYGPRKLIGDARVMELIEHAERFLEVAEQLIGEIAPES